MTIQEIENCRISSVHYPGWDDYFERYYQVMDEGEFYSISKCYCIEKDKVVSVEKNANKVSIQMKNGQLIILTLKE